MTGKFATQTTVPVEKTKADIEVVMRRYGATSFASGWDQERAFIQFDCKERRLRFLMNLPNPSDEQFTTYRRSPQGNLLSRTPDAASGLWEQACRSKWRSLLLVIKAMLEAVEAEIVSFEDAFSPYMVLPNGSSVADWIGPQIAAAYSTGKMPPMLALGPSTKD